MGCLLLSVLLLLGGCGRSNAAEGEDCRMPACIEEDRFLLVNADGSREEVFLDGVNLGAASAGNFPGEFAVDKDSYLRWFGWIGEMNVRVVRVYVNQTPAFYEALAEHNRSAAQPLYLIQGVYADENLLAEHRDVFQEDFRQRFLDDIVNAVDMIHGAAEVEQRPGNAGGVYTADVSRWVIGWLLGIEWDAELVNAVNAAHPDKTAFSGAFVRTEDASPFEVFLAEAAEAAVARDLSYGTQRPVALCNWCTTDPLEHPNEPNPEMEDGAVIDAEHILATEAFAAGFFASYHVYPYYPEFLSYDGKYLTGEDPDPYLAYLEELTAYHSMPVLVAEYGIPSSRGIAHANAVTGMSQGHADERRQAEWIIAMNRDIRRAGCMGALIFAWQDEWFKRSWNTMDYELADRRPFWFNAQSPEESFGLLAFEPGAEAPAALVDGDDGEWRGDEALVRSGGLSVYARADAAYLYLLVRGEDYDFERDTLYLPIGVLDGQGNTRFGGLRFSDGAEFLLRLHGRDDSVLTVDAAYDVFLFDYAYLHDFFEPAPGQFETDSGCFDPIWLAMNRPMLLPETGEVTEFMRFETGRLHYGSVREDSLADLCAGEHFAELRLPWQMLGFMDPSTRQVMGPLYPGRTIEAVPSAGVRLGVAAPGSTETVQMELFTWEEWEQPVFHERLKASYGLLRDYFAEQNGEEG